MTPEDSPQHDLDWLAFCYIADELESADRDAFELRLAEDQAARDAVVSAMEVSQKIYASGNRLAAGDHVSLPTRVQAKSRNPVLLSHRNHSLLRLRLRLSWGSAMATAVLLLVAGGYWLSQNPPTADPANNQLVKISPQNSSRNPPQDSRETSGETFAKIAGKAGHDSVVPAIDETPALAAVWVESLDTSANSFLADTSTEDNNASENEGYTDVVYSSEASIEDNEWLWAALDGLESDERESGPVSAVVEPQE